MFLLSLQKDGRKSEGQKASGNRRVYKLVTFILIMHIYDHLKEVERFVREINGKIHKLCNKWLFFEKLFVKLVLEISYLENTF